MIGRSISEVDPLLKNFIPDEEYYKEYEKDQNAILGKILKREPEPKTATIPLWFTNHAVVDENDKIYWPVLVQHRYVSDEEHADIVMRVIFINVSEWDAMKPRPRKPPQVLHVPRLFKEVRRPAPPDHDVFLSYNSRDVGYVSDLSQMLGRCGVKVWFDQTDFGGGTGLASELLKALRASRILALVLGKNGLGPWQENVEARSQLLSVIKGQKPFVLLVLPEVEPGDAWKNYLGDTELETVLEDRLRLVLPAAAELDGVLSPAHKQTFAERLLRFVIQLLRTLDVRQP
jgi:hypothetical protein